MATLALPGCHELHDNDPDADIHLDEFFWEAELDDYTAVDEYEWDTWHGTASVELEAWDFDGEIRIEVFDDDGVKVFDTIYLGSGGYLLDIEDTDHGDDGDWIVRITSTDVDGHVHLLID